MNMVVDIGNTFTKVGIFERDSLQEKKVFDSDQTLQDFLQFHPASNVIISSVAGKEELVATWSHATGKTILFTALLPTPVQNRYASPETLGADRLAAACGARLLFPDQDCLVIDVGSCINYEFINKGGEYRGGAISPGIRMRFEAMHRLTAKLPAVSPVENSPLTGRSTPECLQSGVMNGALEEIRGIIGRYQIQYPGLRVILCGGDTQFFENHLKPSIFVAPDLVLKGLNSILLYNVGT